jgi:WD40 repeat protein
LVTQAGISHEGNVYAVSFSEDGQTLASVGSDNALRLWNKENGRLLYEIPRAHTGAILDVSFSPKKKDLVVTASFDSRVKIWNVTPGQRQIVPVTLIGHTGGVKSVSFSPDGQTVVSTSFDNTVKLWDLQGKELQTLTGHTASVLSASFDKDGKTLASADSNGRIILWNFDLNDLVRRSCIWLQDYLASPSASEEEKTLCAEPNRPPSQPLATSGPLQWMSSLRDFVGNALR